MDIFTKEQRSKIMASVRSTGTKPEILIRKYLFALGFRFRVNVNSLPGRPDIVLSKYMSVVLVHGCFWHNHQQCAASALPKTRKEYWFKKIAGNVERDNRQIKQLKRLGYQVLVLWECQIKSSKFLKRMARKINQRGV